MDNLRYNCYLKKLGTAQSFVHPKCLPSLLQLQSLSIRTYFQVQEWRENNNLIPCDFSWNLRDGQLHPLTTDIPAAPTNVLNLFKCSCLVHVTEGVLVEKMAWNIL